jgi:hypothetical protein
MSREGNARSINANYICGGGKEFESLFDGKYIDDSLQRGNLVNAAFGWRMHKRFTLHLARTEKTPSTENWRECWFDLLPQIISRLAKATYQLRIASKNVNGGRLFAPRRNPVRVTTTLEVSFEVRKGSRLCRWV